MAAEEAVEEVQLPGMESEAVAEDSAPVAKKRGRGRPPGTGKKTVTRARAAKVVDNGSGDAAHVQALQARLGEIADEIRGHQSGITALEHEHGRIVKFLEPYNVKTTALKSK